MLSTSFATKAISILAIAACILSSISAAPSPAAIPPVGVVAAPTANFVRYSCASTTTYWDGASWFSMVRNCPAGTVCVYCGPSAGSPCVFPGSTCASLGYGPAESVASAAPIPPHKAPAPPKPPAKKPAPPAKKPAAKKPVH